MQHKIPADHEVRMGLNALNPSTLVRSLEATVKDLPPACDIPHPGFAAFRCVVRDHGKFHFAVVILASYEVNIRSRHINKLKTTPTTLSLPHAALSSLLFVLMTSLLLSNRDTWIYLASSLFVDFIRLEKTMKRYFYVWAMTAYGVLGRRRTVT